MKLCLTESWSYKFHRLFPLSQYDLPTHHSGILAFPAAGRSLAPSQSEPHSPEKKTISRESSTLTPEQISRNPDVDYTRYVVSTVISAREAKGEWSKTRFNFSRILGCWTPNTGGSVAVSGGHVCWLNICCGLVGNGYLCTEVTASSSESGIPAISCQGFLRTFGHVLCINEITRTPLPWA